ncbi:anthrone oxygenase family protein [Kribbella sp. NPDC050820]|uniref:anthrone oxygenase family protein n=1 Tax=Kribbella sp. NPDC050820 TaxID=3155408 RepID=UPI0033D56A04
MDRLLRAASLLFTGLFAGFLLGVLVLENSLRGYGAEVYTQVRQVELDALDTLASVTLIPAIIATVVLVIRGGNRRTGLLAAGLLVLVLVTSLVINLPINAEQADWLVQSPPADWAAVRDRWQVAHLVRTVAAVLAFGVLVAGGQSSRPADSRRETRTSWATAGAVRP